MIFLRKSAILMLLLMVFKTGKAQEAAAIDSMKSALSAATTIDEKMKQLDYLSRTLMNVDLSEAEKYGRQLILLAEESRNRLLMIKAYK